VETESQQRRMKNIGNVINVINTSIDSIVKGENLMLTNISGEGNITRIDALENIDKLAQLIENQKNRIAELERQISNNGDADGLDQDMQQMISIYKSQIADKEREIARLREQVAQKDYDIAQLQTKVGTQAVTIAELDRRNAMQTEALKQQDAMLNHCYMRIGDKKSLEQSGIVKRGKLVATKGLDRSKFSKVDIRAFTEVEFDAKRPRILTSMPENSYLLTTNGKDHYVLHITNPTEFWSISNFLVIQTN
ncbi:MAG: hypothetical protein K2L93_08105, partial [Muribaculaceae bacterium]|nr:hypothetical protein [Muribaculaceae bacterium]